jgi:hypothetical protein
MHYSVCGYGEVCFYLQISIWRHFVQEYVVDLMSDPTLHFHWKDPGLSHSAFSCSQWQPMPTDFWNTKQWLDSSIIALYWKFYLLDSGQTCWSGFKIKGGFLLGYDNSTGRNKWQWCVTFATAFRSDPDYSKVNFYLFRNLFFLLIFQRTLRWLPLCWVWFHLLCWFACIRLHSLAFACIRLHSLAFACILWSILSTFIYKY